MIKDIKYRGYTAQPSDYQSPDGDLALSINLINETNSLSPMAPPLSSLSLQNGERIITVHNVNNNHNYIIVRDIYDADDTKAIYWLQVTDETSDTKNAIFIDTIPALRDVAIMGNTLIFASDQGMRYFLWKDNSYRSLGARPPFLIINFGMKYQGKCASSDTFVDVAESCVGSDAASPGRRHRYKATKDELADITQRVYAQLLSAVNETIIANGYFYQPFFIRYAYRMYDGTYAWHSSPILMLPNTTVPIIAITSNEAGSEADKRTVGSQLNIPYFSLNHNICSNQIEQLKTWTDIISAIDIFISAPIYTFDQALDLAPATTDLKSLYEAATTAAVSGSNNANRGRSNSAYLLGHYADNGENAPYIDHTQTVSNSDKSRYWNIRWHERFLENIKSAHLFYKIAEIDIADLAPTNGMKPLNLYSSNLTNLLSRPTLPDDYISHADICPKTLFEFNSRLNLAAVDFIPPHPLPIPASVEFSNPQGTAADYTITVWSRHNGVACHTVHKSTLADDKFNIAAGCPRYIYHPDANAFKMEICISDTTRYTIPLTPHDFLNGAFYFGGILSDHTPPENTEDTPQYSMPYVSMPSKIYTSEINNPFSFPPANINSVGTGSISALSAAAKALSQGQFGQFPLYAFTSEGIWAMEISDSGAFRARQPITRDICINPKAITQIDSAVLFPSARGIMLLSGAEASCISDTINTDEPFNLRQLPHINNLHHTFDPCLTLQPFSCFIQDCRIIYNYPLQRIIIYNRNFPYAYVYSLKTKLWSMMLSNLEYNINSYPHALAVSKDNKVLNMAVNSGSTMPALLVTRPLKLDAPDVLKTIDTVIQRGNFRKGHIQVVLYGSRDLYDWSLIWSSKDHYLRGFRGSPYKYFRIALLCNLDKDESISGASIQYTPRLTNQPR